MSLRAVIGAHNLVSKSAHQTVHTIAKIIEHEHYNPVTIENDIALIRLTEPIDLTNTDGYVNTICLPANDSDYRGLTTISGKFTYYSYD